MTKDEALLSIKQLYRGVNVATKDLPKIKALYTEIKEATVINDNLATRVRNAMAGKF